LGTMQVSEEVEAIEAMGIGPLRFLVAPRMLALFFLMPCLSTVSNISAIFASSLVSRAYFSIAFPYFLDLVKDALLIRDIITGVLKSFMFGLLISAIACYRGLTVKGGAAGVGTATTSSVVTAITTVIGVDTLYNIVKASNSHMVELRDVDMQFEEKKVLDGLSLKVQPKDRLVIMGQTGSGKSTILRLILGTLQPNSGSVFFKQFEITRLRRRKLQQVRQHIGMVYQYSALLSSRNVRDNVALPLEEVTAKSLKEIDKIVDQKLELVGMQDAKELLPSELSGGMRKRVSLARALVLEPELVLLDEPSAGLDPVIASVIDELIISLSEKSKVTSITVTHELGSAFRIGTRMAMLYQGKIIEDAEPEQFKQSKNPVVAQFLSGSTEGPILKDSQDAITKK